MCCSTCTALCSALCAEPESGCLRSPPSPQVFLSRILVGRVFATVLKFLMAPLKVCGRLSTPFSVVFALSLCMRQAALTSRCARSALVAMPAADRACCHMFLAGDWSPGAPPPPPPPRSAAPTGRLQGAAVARRSRSSAGRHSCLPTADAAQRAACVPCVPWTCLAAHSAPSWPSSAVLGSVGEGPNAWHA